MYEFWRESILTQPWGGETLRKLHRNLSNSQCVKIHKNVSFEFFDQFVMFLCPTNLSNLWIFGVKIHKVRLFCVIFNYCATQWGLKPEMSIDRLLANLNSASVQFDKWTFHSPWMPFDEKNLLEQQKLAYWERERYMIVKRQAKNAENQWVRRRKAKKYVDSVTNKKYDVLFKR